METKVDQLVKYASWSENKYSQNKSDKSEHERGRFKRRISQFLLPWDLHNRKWWCIVDAVNRLQKARQMFYKLIKVWSFQNYYYKHDGKERLQNNRRIKRNLKWYLFNWKESSNF